MASWWKSFRQKTEDEEFLHHKPITADEERDDELLLKLLVDGKRADTQGELNHTESSDEITVDDTAVFGQEHPEQYDPRLSRTYIEHLSNVRKGPRSEVFSDFKRGPIEHMRCSPDGQWLVVCYELACLVYDVKVSEFTNYS